MVSMPTTIYAASAGRALRRLRNTKYAATNNPENGPSTRIEEANPKNAPAILLDEPTSGLDPKAGSEFMDLLRSLREESKAILMSTHDIFRAKDIADRVAIMKEGNLVMSRTREELEHENLEALYLEYMQT